MPTLDPCHISRPPTPGITGFVFSCPGREERDAGYPCAGQTGDNLREGLAHLRDLEPHIFQYARPRDYLLTNAWPQVEFEDKQGRYEGATGRSQAELLEVATRQNVERLYDQIAHLHYVVACGDRAQLAVRLCVEFCGLRSRVGNVSHPSSRPLISGKPGTTLAAEIETWAATVGYQLTAA